MCMYVYRYIYIHMYACVRAYVCTSSTCVLVRVRVSCDVPSWYPTKGSRRTSATSTARRQSTETDASVPSRALVYENRVHPAAMVFPSFISCPLKKRWGIPVSPIFRQTIIGCVGSKNCSSCLKLTFRKCDFVREVRQSRLDPKINKNHDHIIQQPVALFAKYDAI